jgi:hypothetical protein
MVFIGERTKRTERTFLKIKIEYIHRCPHDQRMKIQIWILPFYFQMKHVHHAQREEDPNRTI